jgi:hypothetical protein
VGAAADVMEVIKPVEDVEREREREREREKISNHLRLVAPPERFDGGPRVL